MAVTLRLRASGGATSSVVLPDPAVKGTSRGLITAFNPASDNYNSPDNTVIGGLQYFAQNANKPWSLTKYDPVTVRMEVRPGDLWTENGRQDGTSRSEILTVKTAAIGDVVTAEWNYLVEAGPVQNLSWCSTCQAHDGNPFISISIKNDRMNVILNQAVGNYAQPYLDPNPLQRNRVYAMKMQFKTGPTNGFFKFWRDGVLLADYTGQLGSGVQGATVKFGIYEGWPNEVTAVLAARYSNIAVDFPAPAPSPPPLPSGLNKVGETAILGTADSGNAGLICAQKIPLPTAGQLKSFSFYLATAAGNLRLGLYADAGSKPGGWIIDVGPVATKSGWNTIDVVNGPVLQPGNYWPSYEVSSNSAVFRKGNGGSLVVAPARFGALPATFPNPTSSESVHWSFYMTVNVP